nr:HAMP domain-containing sensor histidine kinase [Massilimicrobiota sp. SW1139]
MIIYVISFIVCIVISLLISYILTRRIKKINQCTLAIANNDFDIHLNEKSKDELGVLSHNINQMSQQLKTTIQQLNDEIEYVKKLEGMRKEFIANFTHEIKTPLSIINGYIELIEAGKDDLKKQQYLSAIHQEIEHINQLIMAMLDLSRLESGHVELHKEDIDLEDLLMSIVETFAPILKKKHIHVVMEDEFPHIQGDIKELQTVFQNFMSNAIKHTPQNGHIYIKYHQGILSFENEGKPLSHEQKETIWDTYVSSDRQGTGLGLAICRSILELHGFQYDVCNSEKGVEFQIHIL